MKQPVPRSVKRRNVLFARRDWFAGGAGIDITDDETDRFKYGVYRRPEFRNQFVGYPEAQCVNTHGRQKIDNIGCAPVLNRI